MNRKTRLLFWCSLVYISIVSICVLQAHRKEASLPGGASLRDAILGKDELERTTADRDNDAARSAAWARATAALATLIYALGMGSLVGPRALRLLSGNLLVFLLLLLGLEAFTKVFGIHFPALVRHQGDRNLWVYDSTKGWFHLANATGTAALSGPDRASVRINSLGLRGKEISHQKQEGVIRILVVGDSYVFGLGVDEEHTFTTYLEEFLQARSPDGRYEVVNMGVTGYSTDQEYILFQELGMGLFPDLVILVSCDNDFLANTQNFAYKRYYKPYFELDEERLSLRNSPVPRLDRAQRVKLFLGQESNIWNFVRHKESDRIGPVLDLFQVDVARTTSDPQVDITAALIGALAERVDATGAKFLSINTAHRGEMTPLFHDLRPKLERLGIHQLGLEEFLGNARRENPNMYWDFGEDKHWNRDAHRLAAEIIAGHLFRHGLLP